MGYHYNTQYHGGHNLTNFAPKIPNTMKIKILPLLAMATAAILFTGCEQGGYDQELPPITANATIASSKILNKTTSETFPDNTEINLIVLPEKVDGTGNTLKTSGNYAQTKFKYNKNNNICTEVVTVSAKAIYPNSYISVDLYAFHPHRDAPFQTLKEITKQEYTIKHNQSVAMTDDFMIATVKHKIPNTDAALLVFNRLAAKIEISVTGDIPQVTDLSKLIIKKVKPTIVYNPTVEFNALTNHYAAKEAIGVPVDFTAKNQTASSAQPVIHHAIIPAQTFDANKLKLVMYNAAGEITTTVKLPEEIVFKPGHKYKMNVVIVGYKSLTLSISSIEAWEGADEVNTNLGDIEE